MWILYLIVFDFTRFRYAKNRNPQDHFRCVMVCYRTCTPQKTRPDLNAFFFFFFFFFFEILASTYGPGPYGPVPLTILKNILNQRWCSSTITEKHTSPGEYGIANMLLEQCTILFPGHIWFRKFFQITNDTVPYRTIRSWSIWFTTI